MVATRLASLVVCLLSISLSGCEATQKLGGSLSGGKVDQRAWLNTIEEVKSAVVKIEVTGCQGSGSGSGFITDNWLVSNRHVLEGASKASFKRNGRLAVISKWYLSSTDDLALSPLSPLDSQGSLELGENDPIPGDLVAAAGFPWGGPEVSSFGRILSENSEGGASSLSYVIETNLDIHPGNSGGPLLDTRGYVVGVMFAIDTSTNSSLAIPLSRLVANLNNRQKAFTSSSSC
jgi:S1-C subfamily serine protease